MTLKGLRLVVAAASYLIFVSACGGEAPPLPRADAGRSFPHPRRVVVIVLENRSYDR